MHKTIVTRYGRIHLGPDAERLGFVPGAPVEIITTSTGALIVVLDDSHERAIDVGAADMSLAAPLPGADVIDTVALTEPDKSSTMRAS